MNHGHNTSYKYMTSHNRTDNDDSTLTPYSNKSVSGESYDWSLYSSWLCGTEGHLSQYCSQTIGIDRQEPESHTMYPHMTCVAPHAIPHLSNKQSLPQTDNLDLQRENARNKKVMGLVKGPKHYEFDDE